MSSTSTEQIKIFNSFADALFGFQSLIEKAKDESSDEVRFVVKTLPFGFHFETHVNDDYGDRFWTVHVKGSCGELEIHPWMDNDVNLFVHPDYIVNGGSVKDKYSQLTGLISTAISRMEWHVAYDCFPFPAETEEDNEKLHRIKTKQDEY